MKQVFVKQGNINIEEVPSPMPNPGAVVIKVAHSCISAGTETSGVKEGQKSIVRRVIEQPQNIALGLKLIKEQGLKRFYQTLNGELSIGNPTGYSVSGTVIAIGSDVTKFKVGDRVAAAGANLANHAEYVNVPVNLVALIPDTVDFAAASTTTIGSIALHGVRRVDLKLGEFGIVFGAGILGLLAVQMLKSMGVRVIAVDLDDKRLNLAKEYGAELVVNPKKENAIDQIINYTNGIGADAVLFTAATPSSEPLSDAFKMIRRKGKLVLVGVAGSPMAVKREDIYAKEIDFLISTSYGPGRYDANYEQAGQDYPYAYVRWTENRNMQEYLRLLQQGMIKTEKMIEKRFQIDQADQAFAALMSAHRPLMVILDYPQTAETSEEYLSKEKKVNTPAYFKAKEGIINIGLIGAGSFATGMHLPLIKNMRDKFRLYAVANRTGDKAKQTAMNYQAEYATSNADELIADKNIDLILICTRHAAHAGLVLKSLQAGKHVFVEKPLAINNEQLKSIKDFYQDGTENKPILFVGFNRRFSTYAQEIKKVLRNHISPLLVHYRMNAGYIPAEHWVHQDGGRIIGEGCHIFDLFNFFTEAKITTVSKTNLDMKTSKFLPGDNVVYTLKYADGSVCVLEYFTLGNRQIPKEYCEVHFDGKTAILQDYCQLKGYGVEVPPLSGATPQKGHKEEWLELYQSLSGKSKKWPVELWQIIQATEISFN